MKKKYGIFGKAEYEIDEQGFVTRMAIIQDSGLIFGAPPVELRIFELVPGNDEEYGKRRTAQLNRETDLPFRFASQVRIKVVGAMRKITDEDLLKEGIQPLV